jgi:hypothetical protein
VLDERPSLRIPDALPAANWVVTLDPSEVAVNRTTLDINSDLISVSQAGIDWGDAAIQEYLADLAVGSTLVDYRLPNRTVTINLSVGTSDETTYHTAKAALQQKVALFQREGGWLKRDTGVPLFADVVNATLKFPDQWGPTGFLQTDVVLTLECVPDFYAAEVALDTITATGYTTSVLKQSTVQAVVAGDHPGRCRITVTDTSGHAQKAVVWGFRSRYYDSAATSALALGASGMTPINGGVAVGPFSAAYGGTVLAVVAQTGTWHPFLVTDLLSGGQLTHQGTYRVWARATTDLAGMQLRLAWSLDDTTDPVFNDPVTLQVAGYGTSWLLCDLGTVRAEISPVGSHWWRGVIQAYSGGTAQHVAIDEIWMQPVDESAGTAVASSQPPAFALSSTKDPTVGANDAAVGTVAWSNTGNIFFEDFFYASASIGISGQSQYLTGTGYGFAIPGGATITGVMMQIGYQTTGQGQLIVRLVKAGVVQGASAPGSYAPTTFGGDQVAIYGSPNDLWGLTLTPADINAAGFGAAASWINAWPVNETVQINVIQLQVFYTVGGGFTVAQDAVVNASRIAELRTEGVFREDTASTAYVPVGDTTGDYPRIPPSGLEARAVELLVRPSRGNLASIEDNGIDGHTVAVTYRPSYLFPA